MKVAWLFPGQGAQSVGMGRALAERFAASKAVFEAADGALGMSLSQLCFEGPEAELGKTAVTQPAILTTSWAAVAALRETYPALPAPDFAAGHSLGEFGALVAASALDFQEAVRLVRLRGTAMQEAVPVGQGGMLAVIGADEQKVQQLCADAADGETLSCANFNCPGQIVIAGTRTACDRAQALAETRGMKAIALKVSAPFHCALMAPAAERLRAALSSVKVNPMAFPVVANITARPNLDGSTVKDLLVRQVDGPVLWEQSIRFLADAGVTHALELGPGKVLAGLVKKITKQIQVLSVNDPSGVEAVGQFLG
jgi:[acyl-carrier-protein] S-malonyltransferase